MRNLATKLLIAESALISSEFQESTVYLLWGRTVHYAAGEGREFDFELATPIVFGPEQTTGFRNNRIGKRAKKEQEKTPPDQNLHRRRRGGDRLFGGV